LTRSLHSGDLNKGKHVPDPHSKGTIQRFVFQKQKGELDVSDMKLEFDRAYDKLEIQAKDANQKFIEKLKQLRLDNDELHPSEVLIIDAPLKSKESLWRKLSSPSDKEKYIKNCNEFSYIDLMEVKDILRYTFVLKRYNDVETVWSNAKEQIKVIVDKLKIENSIIKEKERFEKPLDSGYSDYQIFLVDKRAVYQSEIPEACPSLTENQDFKFTIEIQITTLAVFIVKEIAHKIYELERIIDNFGGENNLCNSEQISEIKASAKISYAKILEICKMIEIDEEAKAKCDIIKNILTEDDFCSILETEDKLTEIKGALKAFTKYLFEKAKSFSSESEDLNKRYKEMEKIVEAKNTSLSKSAMQRSNSTSNLTNHIKHNTNKINPLKSYPNPNAIHSPIKPSTRSNFRKKKYVNDPFNTDNMSPTKSEPKENEDFANLCMDMLVNDILNTSQKTSLMI
jgi:hypothetical protein